MLTPFCIMEKNNISRIKNCTVCCSCLNACPVDAISVDVRTFFYNVIVDSSKCIDCGKCLSVCPQNNVLTPTKPVLAYGLINKNDSILKKSSSGGFFYEIAKYIISIGGLVFSAAYSDSKRSVFISSASSESEIMKLTKSKYVESNVGYVFRTVKNELNQGKTILYCGSPCQIAGLKLFLGKDYLNLITCDFACGGFPSHLIFERYLSELSSKNKSEIKTVDFRPKDYGWSRHSILIAFKNEKKYKRLAQLDPYFYNFLYSRFIIRDNCLTCNFTNMHLSDFTMADFWLYKDLSSFQNNSKGISLVHCNNEKSVQLIKKVLFNFEYEIVDLEKSQYNYVAKPKLSESFFERRERFLNTCTDDLYKASVESGMMHGLKSFVFKLKTSIKRKRDK